MAINNGYLKSGRTKKSDECYTPRCGVEPIIKYLKSKKYKTIWCPFDQEQSNFVIMLLENNFNVIFSHIDDNKDFLTYEPEEYDCIVSNPPFSIKDEVLERAYSFNKPFALLLPQNSLQSIDRVEMFINYGLEYLGFSRRLPYYTPNNLDKLPSGNHFASGYFCKEVLPEKMILERLIVKCDRHNKND